MKKIICLLFSLILCLGISIQTSKAEENQSDIKTMYINSEESKETQLIDILGETDADSIINADSYQAGVPGEYTIEYKTTIYEEEKIQKTKIVIVKSEGTVQEIYSKNGNVVNTNREFFNDFGEPLGNLTKLVNDNLDIYIKVKRNDGKIEELKTSVEMGISGGGGGEYDDGTLLTGAGYIPSCAMPYYAYGRVNSPDNVKYYNPPNEEIGGVLAEINLYAVYSPTDKITNVTNDENGIQVQTHLTSVIENQSLTVKADKLNLDPTIEKKMNAKKYKALSIALTDSEHNTYNIKDGATLSVPLDTDMDKNNVIVYHQESGNLKKLESKVTENYVKFNAPQLPGDYIIAEENQAQIIVDDNQNEKPEEETDIQNESQKDSTNNEGKKEENTSTHIVKTDDQSEIFLYLMVGGISILGFILVRKSYQL